MSTQLTTKASLLQIPTKAESKSDITNKISRSIIEGEVTSREKKTERLRKARLLKEEAEALEPAKEKPKAVRKTKKSAAAG